MRCRSALRGVVTVDRCVMRAGTRAARRAFLHTRPDVELALAGAAGVASSSAAPAAAAAAAPVDDTPETVFYEGSGANAELALSLLLGLTIIYAPLTIASIGRRLWIKYRCVVQRLQAGALCEQAGWRQPRSAQACSV